MKMNIAEYLGFSKAEGEHQTQVIPRKRYLQLKDTHVAKAGMIWEFSDVGYTYSPVTMEYMTISDPNQWREPKRAVEENKEWFEQLMPVYLDKSMMNKMQQLMLDNK